ncbi:MAG TPA: methionyl-tRNA formyltransferase [Spirochaetota bacterium]|mgnify:CR=1 FL=1|nr:methionyl-tRNA formyltransferase [Spirochaetota bacterium]HPN83683.1 methionyl-tRNA formyltransferase [Spirochaetota bacterium]
MRFLFFGTPDYTTRYLDCLSGMGAVVGVVTAPDRPSGRGRGLHRPGPAIWAHEHGIPCFQPDSPRDPAFPGQLAPLDADLGIVVAYGRILPRSVFALPRLETINVHFSLLPAFRGASPIESALLCGTSETGVSVQRIVEALDAGDVLDSEVVPVADGDHYPELFDKLVDAGPLVLQRAVKTLATGKAVFIPQSEPAATHCGKIQPEMRRINWNTPLPEVFNRIRAFAGHRTAWTSLRGSKFLVHRACPCPATSVPDPGTPQAHPGIIIRAAHGEICVVCGDGNILSLLDVQPENRRRMSAADCINGLRLQPGEQFQ